MFSPTETNPDFSGKRADIWIIDPGDFDDCDQRLLGLLQPDELERHARFASRQTAATWLATRACLRFLLSRYLKEPVRSLMIETAQNGKPFVSNHFQICFNVSHSADIAVIAISDRDIGIDVEHLERRVDSAAVLRRFFSPAEQASYAQYQPADPRRTFFRGWTRKEAVLKATGEGIAGLAHNEISFAPALSHAMLTYRGSTDAAAIWFFHEFEPAIGYIASLAAESAPLQIKETRLTSPMLEF